MIINYTGIIFALNTTRDGTEGAVVNHCSVGWFGRVARDVIWEGGSGGGLGGWLGRWFGTVV